MTQHTKTEIFSDPMSVPEQLAADSLRDSINHPFAHVKVFHTEQRRPIEAVRMAEVREIGHGALTGATQQEELKIAS